MFVQMSADRRDRAANQKNPPVGTGGSRLEDYRGARQAASTAFGSAIS